MVKLDNFQICSSLSKRSGALLPATDNKVNSKFWKIKILFPNPQGDLLDESGRLPNGSSTLSLAPGIMSVEWHYDDDDDDDDDDDCDVMMVM